MGADDRFDLLAPVVRCTDSPTAQVFVFTDLVARSTAKPRLVSFYPRGNTPYSRTILLSPVGPPNPLPLHHHSLRLRFFSIPEGRPAESVFRRTGNEQKRR